MWLFSGRIPSDLNGLIRALESKDPKVRWKAAKALGYLKDGSAIIPLIRP